MASISKSGAGWRAQIRRKDFYDAQTFRTKQEARAWAAKIEGEWEGTRAGRLPKKTLKEALEKYALDVSPTKGGERWEKLRLAKYATLDIAQKWLADVSQPDIAAWRDARLKQVAGSTVAREMNLWHSVFEQARKEWKWLHKNPMDDVSRPEKSPDRMRRCWPHEVEAILAKLGYTEDGPIRTQAALIGLAWLLAIETAMRAGEIRSLREETVFLEKSYVHLPKTKNGDARDVPLSPRAKALLSRVTPVEGRYFPISAGSFDAQFRTARKKTTVTDLTFHDSRHEACTRLAKKIQVLDLARMIGHRDLKSLMIYYNPTAEEIAQQLAA